MPELKVEEPLQIDHCPACGLIFAWPKSRKEELLRRFNEGERVTWYCPNGHPIGFAGKSALQKAEEELSATRQRNAELFDDLADANRKARAAAADARAAKAEIHRVAARTTAGVCPCCNRTFKQLAAHMRTKHPGEVVELHPQAALGGLARAANMTPERRKEIAQRAARARWGGP